MSEYQSTSLKPMAAHDIHLVFSATEDAVRAALNSVRQSLHAFAIDDMTLGTIEIVLAETANNIVEHAYSDSGTGTIVLSCQKESGLVRFELIDNGHAFPGGEIPAKQTHNLEADLQVLPEGGFGWGLIRDMTTSLVYRHVDGKNILQFTILIEPH
jgi:serine/threonine-protein kinase RsbW